MFYLGRHWGHKDDGYICSSRRMKTAFQRRPHDFKRRIVSIVNDRDSLILEEQRWLSLIDVSDFGTRYYNISNNATTPSMRGKSHSEETKQKMRAAAKGRPKSEEHKQKIRLIRLGTKASEQTKQKMSQSRMGQKRSAEFCAMMSTIHSNRSPETRAKISAITKRRREQGTFGRPRRQEH
jgi:hypothetical protein